MQRLLIFLGRFFTFEEVDLNELTASRFFSTAAYTGFRGRSVITRPTIFISIQPDATKPVSLEVQYDNSSTYTVSEVLPGMGLNLYLFY